MFDFNSEMCLENEFNGPEINKDNIQRCNGHRQKELMSITLSFCNKTWDAMLKVSSMIQQTTGP